MNRLLVPAVAFAAFLLGCPPDHDDPPAPTHAISGTVTRAGGGALVGVAVTLGGAATASTVTDATGGYRFGGLANGSYTLSPALAGYVFAPSTPSVTVSGADATQHFSADGAYTISGTVSGPAQGGATIELSGGGVVKPDQVSAQDTGAYAFTGIPNGTYTLTPSLAGHAFTPAQATVTVAGGDQVRNFGSSAPRSISGTVRDTVGAPLAGMTVRLSGASAAIATTDAAGGYSFRDLAQGSTYTVEEATFGYSPTPAERTYTLAADVTGADFSASLGTMAFSFAGTVSYAGTRTGPIYVTIRSQFDDSEPRGGTGLLAQQAPWSGRPFEVRNVQANGPVVVRAWMDTLGVGRFNAGADPAATVTVSTFPSASIDLGDLELADPSPAPIVASPVAVNAVVPADGWAIAIFDVPRDAQGDPLADEVVISWNDSATVDPTHRLGSLVVPAGSDFALVHGLTNGTDYWFRLDAYLGGAPLAGQTATTSSGVRIGAPGGTASVTGKITHPVVPPPSALYVIAQAGEGSGGRGIYAQRIGSPPGTETPYALSLPPGTYQLFAFFDADDDGYVAPGEPALFPNGSAALHTFVAGPNAGPSIVMLSGNAAPSLRTSRWADRWSDWTNLVPYLDAGAKAPLRAGVTGPGLRGPFDLGMSKGAPFALGGYFQTNPILPYVGDTYTFDVTYADGSRDSFPLEVTGVFGTPPRTQAPAEEATGVTTTPTFAWTPPTGAPAEYAYQLQVWPQSGGNGVWETSLPKTATSVRFNADGRATVSELSPYTTYEWVIRAIDAHGNDASWQSRFTTGASQQQLPLVDPLDGTVLDGLLWQTPQYTRAVSGGVAMLGVQADDMQAFTVQGAQYLNSMAVLASGNRVTTLRATVSVDTGALQRTGTGVASAGVRLLYQPAANRGLPFPNAIMNTLMASLELYDAGDGLRVRRRVLHCDVPSCVTNGAAGIATTDPAGFTASADGIDASAPAQYDTPYVLELTVNEATGVFTWSIHGGGYTDGTTTGTANASTWLAGKMTLANGFTIGQLFSRAIDLVGGSGAGIVAGFDDVYVGFNGGAAALWDDFQTFGATALDPSRWGAADSDVWMASGLHLSSAVRTAVAGAFGESTPVNLMYPRSLRAMAADVVFAVNEPAAIPESSTSFSIVGAFFNAGGGGGPNDATGDVRARIALSSAGASYSILRCANATCSSGTTVVASGPLSPTRPMTPGMLHAVLLEWNATARTLTFAVDDATPVVVDVTPLVTVASPTPSYPLHQLMTNVWVGPTATAGTSSRVEAVVTNVRGIAN